MQDWRNSEEYSYTADLTLHQWAWEFLRRNPEYRAAWEEFQGTSRLAKEYGAREEAAGAEWGLEWPVDPDLRATEARFYFSGSDTLRRVLGVSRARANMVTMLEIDLERPLRPQLQIALKRLRHDRDEAKRRGKIKPCRPKTRAQTRLYPCYVRLLDGSLAGVGMWKMGKELFPDLEDLEDRRQRARTRLRSARKLASGGYRELLQLPDE